MRILIATTYAPFTDDPAAVLADRLRAELTARGFTAECALLPFAPDAADVVEQTAALRLLDLRESCGNRIDRLVTLRYPSFALAHPNKVCWFTAPAGTAATLMRRSDNAFLRECRGVFTTSWAAAERVRRFHRMEPNGVLYPPLASAHPFEPGPFGDYLLVAPGRTPLATDAVAFADPRVRVVVLGDGATASERVRFAGAVTEGERAELLAGSCGLVHLDPAGDPFGYSAQEAFHARKPVLCLSGAGGAFELVLDGQTGLVSPPLPETVGAAMTRLWNGRAEGERMGQAGHATLARALIDWDVVTRGLTS